MNDLLFDAIMAAVLFGNGFLLGMQLPGWLDRRAAQRDYPRARVVRSLLHPGRVLRPGPPRRPTWEKELREKLRLARAEERDLAKRQLDGCHCHCAWCGAEANDDCDAGLHG